MIRRCIRMAVSGMGEIDHLDPFEPRPAAARGRAAATGRDFLGDFRVPFLRQAGHVGIDGRSDRSTHTHTCVIL